MDPIGVSNTKFFCASMAGEFPDGNVYYESYRYPLPVILDGEVVNRDPRSKICETSSVADSQRFCAVVIPQTALFSHIQEYLWVLVIGEPPHFGSLELPKTGNHPQVAVTAVAVSYFFSST